MSYLRFSGSDWYVYASAGGLSISSCRTHGESALRGDYSFDEVKALLSGEARMESIPGWRNTASSERQLLLWVMREYVGDESEEPENLYQIGDDEYTPSIRQLLRKGAKRDLDGER